MWKKEESGFYLRAPHRAHKKRKRSLRDANDSDDGREMGLNKYTATTPKKFSKHFQKLLGRGYNRNGSMSVSFDCWSDSNFKAPIKVKKQTVEGALRKPSVPARVNRWQTGY